jgi:hypothetical protein
MPDDSSGPPSGEIKRRPSSSAPHDSRPFDLWLNRQLHALYDDIARQPLPADLVTLIQRQRRPTICPVADPAGPALASDRPGQGKT